ncbi:hypothetical protein DW159_05000 [Coprococcus sp. AM14-16]|jgi:conserved hypothetical protein|uniref:hypothetical protein n=1 Tax=Coprococcus TaxID=33042 RepID=UPI000E42615D|nr:MULTISPECIES: hypothetical protein [Coprococcus]MBD9292501.1 hypothetical protein [Coprococcus eutactus]RGD41348.1 hypothetical protein DW159_05000 [Coprococcus sp. AM14-16]RJW74194.1 hypothetical protein DW025_13310 [Coprococcus sp. AF38-1]
MDYSIYDYNSDEKLLQEQEIEEINNVKMSLLNTLVTKLNNAGIYFNSTSRIKSESSLLHKLETGKYSMQEGGRKIQDIIGIRINLFYLEDMDICEKILEETFLLDNWSKTKNEENKFEAQKCNGVFRIPSKYLRNIPASVWNKPFDQTFEVQLRTVLFEGWHEIEHEMRYKYKLGSDSKETDLWTGHEDLSRVMNSIIANLELCDWSIMQIFNSIHDSQYKEKNWENAIRSKYRLRITQDPLKPELREYLDNNPDIVAQFHTVSKRELVEILLNKKYHKELTPDRVIYLINKEIVHNEYISRLLDKEQFVPAVRPEVKTEIKPMVPNVVYSHRVGIPAAGYDKACEIIYKWVREHISMVFPQMPEELTSVDYSTIGYKVYITYEAGEFHMDFQHISNSEAGAIWHVTVDMVSAGDIYDVNVENICETINVKERRYSRPKFMKDMFNQVGFVDAGIVMEEGSSPEEISYDKLNAIVESPDRYMPIIVIVKPDEIPDWAIDCDGYILRTDMLKKTLNGLCHVYLCSGDCKKRYEEEYGKESVDGGVMMWEKNSNYPIFYSMDIINQSFFEEVNHSINENVEYEKSFRYSLREQVHDEYLK